MFLIYDTQIAQLTSIQQNRLIGEIKNHIALFFPEEYAALAADSQEDNLVKNSLHRARAFGLSTDRNLTVYTDFVMTFGTDFPENDSWALAILTDLTLHEDEKIDELIDELDHTE